jgi:arylformamidase
LFGQLPGRDKLKADSRLLVRLNDTPEFQRQTRDFAAAVKAAGKPVELFQAVNFGHQEMLEFLADSYGPNGRAALKLMKL